MSIFIQSAQIYVMELYQVSEDSASRIISLPNMIALIFVPFMGMYIDRVGRRQWFLMGSSSLIFVIHIIWLMVPTCPKPRNFYNPLPSHPKKLNLLEERCNPAHYYIPLLLMGVFYAFFGSVIWPCFPLVMDKKYIGTAFGV